MGHCRCKWLLTALLLAVSSTAAERYTIAVIPQRTRHEFWKSVYVGAVQAARELGVDLIWKGPFKEDDCEAQIAEVENCIDLGVSGIVLAPLDDMALRAPVRNAALEGIPVVIIDSRLKSREYVSFVAPDHFKGGQLAGQYLATLLKGRGRVTLLRYQEGSASTMNRERGFLQIMAQYPEIQVVNANQYGGTTVESAHRASEGLLALFRTEEGGLALDGIFCPNESTTFGMLRALQDGKLAGKVRFVGFGSSEKLVQALKIGEIDGLVLQNPVRMGYLGVQTLVRYLNGEKVEKQIDIEVYLATRENMEEPEIAALLEPGLAQGQKP